MEDSPHQSNVSVIIPVYNDSDGILETLRSISDSTFGLLSDVIVVDNMSTDDTKETIKRQQKPSSINLSVEDRIQGSYAARNKGISEVRKKTDWIVFLDADEIIGTDCIKTALESADSQSADYLGFNVELTLPENTLIGRYNAHTGFPVKQYLENENYAPTCALLIRREVFEDVGLFDARLISGGDREFGERVHEAGYDQGYAEDATVYHPARTSFESLAKKNFRVGRGFCQKQRYYPERYGKPGLPPKPPGSSSTTDFEDETDGDEYAPSSLFEKLAFIFLSIAMLACRGFGYYYEFFFGEKRDDIPAPTTS